MDDILRRKVQIEDLKRREKLARPVDTGRDILADDVTDPRTLTRESSPNRYRR